MKKRYRTLLTGLLVSVLAVSTIFSVLPAQAAEYPQEIIALRTETTKTYDLGNGIRALKADTSPVHYWDGGQWLDIDSNYSEVDTGAYTAKFTRLPYLVRMGDDSARRIYPDRDDLTYWIDIGKPFPSMGTPEKIGGYWVWNYPNSAIAVRVTNTSVKFAFRLKNSNSPSEITIPIDTEGIVREGNKLYHDGELVAVLKKPYAVDAEGTERDCEVTFNPGSITISLDTEGLVYPIDVDPTIDTQVAAGADDGTSGALGFSNSAEYIKIGQDSGSYTICNGFARYPGISGLSGATIITANTSFYGFYSEGTSLLSNVYCEDAEAPGQISDTADYESRVRTTAFTVFDVDPRDYDGTAWYAIIITSVIQELADSHNPSVIQILWDDDGSASTNDLFIRTYEYSDNSYGMTLYIEYTAGGVSAPTVVTSAATAVTCNSANGTGNVTATGGANVTAWGIQYGIGAFTANVSDTGNQGAAFDFSLEISGLTPSTEYQTRAYAVNSVNISYGNSVNFTTSASANPTVTTNNATNILYTSATLNGTISGLTCANATSIMFEWGTSTGNYTANWTDTGSWGNVSFNHTPTLSSNTTYVYRGGAALSGGAWQYGSEVSFYTLTYGTPAVVTANATSVSYTSATGQGNITDTGNTTISERGFQLGIGGFTDNVSESGSYSTGNYTLPITGLIDNTEYQYRAYIYSDELATFYYGATVNFTTLDIVAPTVATINATSITSTTATLSGNVTATGGPNYDTRFVEWGTSSGNYTSNSTSAGDFGIGVFNINISSLSANTTYYWRPGAINSGNVGYGGEESFATSAAPPTVPDAPADFTLTDQGGVIVGAEWSASTNATGYLILVSRTGFPLTTTGYEIAYNGTATSANFTGYDLGDNTYYFSLWAYNVNGYSTDYATASIGGDAMIFLFLSLIPLGLTVGMFASKQSMLGFPCTIFWAILGGYAYTQSTIPWGDWQYFLFIGCLIGMAPFSAVAAFALRTKKEEAAIGEEFIDEGREQEVFIDEKVGREDGGDGKGSRRALGVRDRAEKRRKVGAKPKTDYGEFR